MARYKNGITLIALVITIIVLLILAGISIMMLTGENSILEKAAESKDKTVVGEFKDKLSIAQSGVLIKISSEKSMNKSYSPTEENNFKELAEDAGKVFGVDAKKGRPENTNIGKGYTVGYYLDSNENGYIVVWYNFVITKNREDFISENKLSDLASGSNKTNTIVLVGVINVKNDVADTIEIGVTSQNDADSDIQKSNFSDTGLESIKYVYGNYVLMKTDNLYRINNINKSQTYCELNLDKDNLIFISGNVREFYSKKMAYITNSNELYIDSYYDTNDNEFVKELNNVLELYDIQRMDISTYDWYRNVVHFDCYDLYNR